MTDRIEPHEKETLVRFDKTDSPMSVFTYEKTMQTHLRRAGATLVMDNGNGGMEFEMPKNWFRLPRPRVRGKKAEE